MTDIRVVSCARKTASTDICETIAEIGGSFEDGRGWHMDHDEAVELIRGGKLQLIVEDGPDMRFGENNELHAGIVRRDDNVVPEPETQRYPVIIATSTTGMAYLCTEGDEPESNKLLALPPCVSQ